MAFLVSEVDDRATFRVLGLLCFSWAAGDATGHYCLKGRMVFLGSGF